MATKSKSGIIRKVIGPIQARLADNITASNQLITAKIPNDEERATELVNDIEKIHAKIETSISSIENRDRQWADLIESLSEEAAEAEEIIYDETAMGPDGYILLLEDGKEMLKHLSNKKNHIVPGRQASTSTSGSVTNTSNQLNDSNSASNTGSRIQTAKLPKLELPFFSGNVNEWKQFWTIFEANVHNRDLTGVEKFSYLQSRLQGDAVDPIGGLPMTDEAYVVAVDMLKQRFQRSPEQLVSNLYSQLKRIPRSSEKVKDLQKTYDLCERLLRQLKEVGEDTDSNRSLVLDIYSKYPEAVLSELTRRKAISTTSTLSHVQLALKDYIEQTDGLSDMLQDLQPFNRDTSSKSNRSYTDSKSSPSSGVKSTGESSWNRSNSTALTVSDRPNQVPNSPCYFCNGQHFNSMCDQFKTAEQRQQQLEVVGRCLRCMDNTHSTDKCRTYPSKIRCHFCQSTGVHPSPLCPTTFNGTTSANVKNTSNSSQQHNFKAKPSGNAATKSKTESTPCALGVQEQALLSTAIATIRNPESGQERPVRVILDNGCPRTFILESVASELNLTTQPAKNLYISAFGCKRTSTHASVQVRFELRLRDGRVMDIDSNTVQMIVNRSAQPTDIPEATRRLTESMGEAMADSYQSECPPEVLIGSDYFWELIQCNRMETGDGLFLIPSSLGFLLGGRCVVDQDGPGYPSLLCITERTSTSEFETALSAISSVKRSNERYPDIDEFWSLETIGIRDDPVEKDDDIAQQQFDSSVRFEDGRYQVCWPWKESHLLPTNYSLALGRLKSLSKRLAQADPTLLCEYQKTINEQLQRGIIEEVPQYELKSSKNLIHYLPHHPVVREGHATTKIRIVYDASARCGREAMSLNQCLYRGPVILPDLCSILIRFRLYPVAIVADIEKAFLQLGLQPSQRDVTRFLWFRDVSTLDDVAANKIVTYRFCRVPFGVISSPFLLAATVRFHLDEAGTSVAIQIRDSIYVDNVFAGADSDVEAIEIYDEAKDIFKGANMNLREWCTNSSTLIDHIPEVDKCAKRTVKVLGLWWDSENDKLQLQNHWAQRVECRTKRAVLQAIASIYDPIGLFQPCTLQAKCFLRELWEDGHDWDDEITVDQRQKWELIHADILPIFDLAIPRFVEAPATSERCLVVFSDASKEAYATAVYLRVRGNGDSGGWKSNLIYAKSRLSPRKQQKPPSLPRLELLGLAIAVRAADFVRSSLKSPLPIRCVVFCDSVCVLSWLRTDKPLQRFVANRVMEIKLLENAEYHYVRTFDNPADLGTRGLTGREIANSSFWWRGPAWLQKEGSEWPAHHPIEPIHDEEFMAEIQKTSKSEVSLLAGEGPESNGTKSPFDIDATRFSSLRRLLRVTARCFKFLKKLWNQSSVVTRGNNPKLNQIFEEITNETYLTSSEVLQAKHVWIEWIQFQQFEDVFDAIKSNKSHQLISQLNLEIGNDGIIRCVGRLVNADLPPCTLTPILLPKDNHVTNLIIKDTHEKLMHDGGISHTLNEVRRLFWIPQGRTSVRRVLTRCTICRRNKGPAYGLPNMPPLPRERVSRSRPFQYTGVDYLGPVTVKMSDESAVKMWCCLFTCLTVRAVHLEAILDCTAQSFVECLTRFVARRGCPEQMISDNAPQFRLAKSLMERTWNRIAQDETVLAYISEKGIAWRCITELAPWQGGFYERLVGVVKSTFKSTIGRRYLRWDEFFTLITEAEAIVNSRPITYVHSDIDSGLALRPMDFLVEQPTGTPVIDATIKPEGGEASIHLMSFWKAKQRRLDNVWKQWYDDYLLSLRERDRVAHKGARSKLSGSPSVGEIVIVKNTDAPRGSWKLARVTNLIPSKDGSVRSVELKLPNGLTLRRPTNHVYSLEVPQPPSEPGAAAEREQTVPGAFADDSDEEFLGFDEDEVVAAERQFAIQFPESANKGHSDVNMVAYISAACSNIAGSLTRRMMRQVSIGNRIRASLTATLGPTSSSATSAGSATLTAASFRIRALNDTYISIATDGIRHLVKTVCRNGKGVAMGRRMVLTQLHSVSQ